MKIIECLQGSPEWLESRRGIPTSSNFDKIITNAGKPSTQRKKYLFKLAGEYVSETIEESYQSAAMLRGCVMEIFAKQLYQIMEGVETKDVGFCITEGEYKYGASPDALVEERGLLEVKCPSLAVHVEYLLKDTLPIAYFMQIQGQLLVTGREWVDFFSYYPTLKPLLIRVHRDEEFIKKLKIELIVFCHELQTIIQKIK